MCQVQDVAAINADEMEIQNREAFYEELHERMLAIENGEYDCGQCSDSEFDEFFEEEIEEELENCTICNSHLENHKYGNVCAKHIPSYALWDEDDEEYEDEHDEHEDEEYDEEESEDEKKIMITKHKNKKQKTKCI